MRSSPGGYIPGAGRKKLGANKTNTLHSEEKSRVGWRREALGWRREAQRWGILEGEEEELWPGVQGLGTSLVLVQSETGQ